MCIACKAKELFESSEVPEAAKGPMLLAIIGVLVDHIENGREELGKLTASDIERFRSEEWNPFFAAMNQLMDIVYETDLSIQSISVGEAAPNVH